MRGWFLRSFVVMLFHILVKSRYLLVIVLFYVFQGRFEHNQLSLSLAAPYISFRDTSCLFKMLVSLQNFV